METFNNIEHFQGNVVDDGLSKFAILNNSKCLQILKVKK